MISNIRGFHMTPVADGVTAIKPGEGVAEHDFLRGATSWDSRAASSVLRGIGDDTGVYYALDKQADVWAKQYLLEHAGLLEQLAEMSTEHRSELTARAQAQFGQPFEALSISDRVELLQTDGYVASLLRCVGFCSLAELREENPVPYIVSVTDGEIWFQTHEREAAFLQSGDTICYYTGSWFFYGTKTPAGWRVESQERELRHDHWELLDEAPANVDLSSFMKPAFTLQPTGMWSDIAQLNTDITDLEELAKSLSDSDIPASLPVLPASVGAPHDAMIVDDPAVGWRIWASTVDEQLYVASAPPGAHRIASKLKYLQAGESNVESLHLGFYHWPTLEDEARSEPLG